jgi:hypothetical protein
MNKREFVAASVGAVIGAPALAAPASGAVSHGTLGRLLERTRRLPDLVEHVGAASFQAYVGERFTIVGGPGSGAVLTLRSVREIRRCDTTEQFDVSFAAAHDAGDVRQPPRDGVRVIEHATGQRLALHLEHLPDGYAARFNLLA